MNTEFTYLFNIILQTTANVSKQPINSCRNAKSFAARRRRTAVRRLHRINHHAGHTRRSLLSV
ncbi:hypothetical protein HanPI659440_Chr13g0513551 [Helianthus annuus]|nr:hypothetical protein HanPI659440_Chr13g0513551 [Helianthus annuus]